MIQAFKPEPWRIATRYDKLAANYLFVQLAAIRIRRRADECAPWVGV
jgi:hypothetical protein